MSRVPSFGKTNGGRFRRMASGLLWFIRMIRTLVVLFLGPLLQSPLASATSLWCGENILIDSPEDFEAFVQEHYPRYFESAKVYDKATRKLEPLTRYTFNGPIHKLAHLVEGDKQKYEFVDPDAFQIDWNGQGVEATLLDRPEKQVGSWEEFIFAVVVDDKAILVNGEMNTIVLCQRYSAHEKFVRPDLYLSSLPGSIADLIFSLRPHVERHRAHCDRLLEKTRLPREEIDED